MLDFFKSKLRRRSLPRSRQDYTPLHPSSEEAQYERSVSGESMRFLIWGLLLAILILVVTGLSLINTSTSDPYAYDRHDTRTKRCGDTAARAKSLGCHFDPTIFSWVPNDCLDHELVSEFRALEWTLYGDKNKMTLLTEEEWSNGTDKSHEAWLTSKDTGLHCIFSWKRMHRAIMSGRNLPEGLSSWANTENCAKALTSHMQPDEIAIEVHVEFPAC
ncbi:hypothetical protein GQ607_014726 [Colletotrichum asianum]|uniref:Uncharacterized protein n=1 Tax=Colletotrichum asianum TaxID=702518 RepID=A0A8H3W194_9PEZI|nr:hypothetical protein GQ607_014726 [Colletotrichum asianum]